MLSLIDIYYQLSEIMEDDTEILICAIKELTNTKKKNAELRNRLEKLNLDTIAEELNELYDIEIKVLKRFCFNKKKVGCQTEIWDFL